MDWFSSVRAKAQEAVNTVVNSEAAGRARQLAQQASQQAAALAKEASVKAQVPAQLAASASPVYNYPPILSVIVTGSSKGGDRGSRERPADASAGGDATAAAPVSYSCSVALEHEASLALCLVVIASVQSTRLARLDVKPVCPMQGRKAGDASPAQYGITPELEQFVRSLTYSTFRYASEPGLTRSGHSTNVQVQRPLPLHIGSSHRL